MALVRASGPSITPAPDAFDGELADLYATSIEANLPAAAEVEYWHHKILEHSRRADALFVVRQVAGLERGTIYTTASDEKLKPSDNAPAWWMHLVTFQGIRDLDFERMPTHMFEVSRCFPTSINDAGWHVAHILNAKDRNTDWLTWSRDELVRRFVRNIHPCNCFYIPKREWHRYGGDSGVIGFFASGYVARYAAVWREFLSLAGGVQPAMCSLPRYVYAAATPTANPVLPSPSPASWRPSVSASGVRASYPFSRFCFRADIIEQLAMNDLFEVVTPVGTFRMTKAEFYTDFPNVVASASYREGRIYHSPRPPKKAEKYRVL